MTTAGDCADLLERANQVCGEGAQKMTAERGFVVAAARGLQPQLARAVIDTLKPRDGWLMLLSPQGSEIIDLPAQNNRLDDRIAAEAEFIGDTGASYRLARGAKGLDLVAFGATAGQALKQALPDMVESVGGDYLVERVERLNIRGGVLRYRVFWRRYAEFGLRPAFSVFDGFADGGRA